MINRNPYNIYSGITIEGRPIEHEKAIERQGQYVRLIQAKKCPCIKSGQPSLFCSICKGKGYSFTWQTAYEVLDENSPHGLCSDLAKLYPYFIPVVKVNQVQRFLHNIQGGNHFYEIDNFTATDITLKDDGKLPKRFEQIKCSYSYRVQNEVVNEDSFHDGSFIIKTLGTEVDTAGRNSNPMNAHGDIYSVSRVYNKTQDFTYTVLSFGKRSIVLSSGGGAPVPISTDVLEVDYLYTNPIRASVGKIDTKDSLVKWGEDVKQSDITVNFAGGWYVRRGNIVSLLTTLIEDSVVVVRGTETRDELPFFDVHDITENIVDEDNVSYVINTNFKLVEYNDIVWVGTKPATGKRYSVALRYNPSFMIYKEEAGKMNAEDKRFPVSFLARLMNKFTTKDLGLI